MEKQRKFVLGVDYYIEKGRWVFTEHYLRTRGYCCKSGCRHCPYGYEKQPPQNQADHEAESK